MNKELPGVFKTKSGYLMHCCEVDETHNRVIFSMDVYGPKLQYVYNLNGELYTCPDPYANLVIELPFVYVMKEGDVVVGRGENDTIICIVKSIKHAPDGKLKIETHVSFNMNGGVLAFNSGDFKDVKTITKASDIETWVLFDQLVHSDKPEATDSLYKFFDVSIEVRDTEEKKDGPCNYMGFGTAIKLFDQGEVLQRVGWDNRGLVVFKQVPAEIGENIVHKMTSLPQKAKDIIMKSQKLISYSNQCILYNLFTGEATSWIPTMEDIFAEDWVTVRS